MGWFACRRKMGEISSGRGAGGRREGCRRRRSCCIGRHFQWRFISTNYRRDLMGRCLGESGRRVLEGGLSRIPCRTGSRLEWIASLLLMHVFGCPQIAICVNIFLSIDGKVSMVMVLCRKSHWIGCLSLTFLPQNQQGFSFMASSYGGSPQINGPDRYIERHKVFVSRPKSQSYSWRTEELEDACCIKCSLLCFPFSLDAGSCFW